MIASRQPFARRIVVAFMLATLLVSGLFSLGIVAIVHFVEQHLVSRDMSHALDSVVQDDLRLGQKPRLDPDMRFYASNFPGYAIPARFSNLEEGFSEVIDGNEAYYVFMRELNGNRYVLIQDQQEFEAREQALFAVILAGFLLSVVGGTVLGWLMARHVMAPLARLAQQVGDRDQLLSGAAPLRQDYADDEIGQLASAFDSTLGQLRATLDRERLFTNDVSHELRTPLMVLTTTCELLEAAPLDTRERELVDRIARSARDMRDLVDTFLTLARAHPGKSGDVEGSLPDIAADECARWEPLIREKGLGFALEDAGAAPGSYPRTLLRSVLGNLIRNALHYTERGRIRVVLDATGFRVEDTGVGVPDVERETIFEPFKRGSQARGEGLGLGLSLVRRICADQGWSITVATMAGGGSCFTVGLH